MNMSRLLGIFSRAKASPAPEPSCFVKGVIRSICENPQEWSERDSMGNDYWYAHPSGLTVSYWTNWSPPRASVIGHKIAPHETQLLTQVVQKVLVKPTQDRLKEARLMAQQIEEAKLAAERAPFEKLGCPDNT